MESEKPAVTSLPSMARLLDSVATKDKGSAANPKEPALSGVIEPSVPRKLGHPRKDEQQTNLRKNPADKMDVQGDFFFAPVFYDISAKDSRGIMDVAPFKLSKNKKRQSTTIRYELGEGFIEVSSGNAGMASVWDYDIVLMAISYLTEAMNRYREGKGEKPPQVFRPHVSDVLKFCRRDNGGTQKKTIVDALERLSTTHVKIERVETIKGKKKIVNQGDNLIGPYKTISSASTKKVEFIEFKVPDWVYDEITKGDSPDVLTVHPDYFLIEPGVARFIYRLARRSAGKDSAEWNFRTIYERSGSESSFGEFCRLVRKAITANDLPEYHLSESDGNSGPKLAMVHRAVLDSWKISGGKV